MFSKSNKKITIEQFETLKSRVENLSNLVISLQRDIEIMRNNDPIFPRKS